MNIGGIRGEGGFEKSRKDISLSEEEK